MSLGTPIIIVSQVPTGYYRISNIIISRRILIFDYFSYFPYVTIIKYKCFSNQIFYMVLQYHIDRINCISEFHYIF